VCRKRKHSLVFADEYTDAGLPEAEQAQLQTLLQWSLLRATD